MITTKMATSGASQAERPSTSGNPCSAKKRKHDLIFLVDKKIQGRRFKTLLQKSKEKGFTITSKFSTSVSHVVTECADIDELLQLQQLEPEVVEDDQVHVVKTAWLSECLREGQLVPVKDAHKLHYAQRKSASCSSATKTMVIMPEYACQRITPLRHSNERFTRALQVLEKEADMRGDKENDSRALAFRKGMTTLASYPQTVHSVREIKDLPDIGKHIQRVVQEILETGSCQEVEDIEASQWFQVNKRFQQTFGVGPATSQTWYSLGLRTIQDALNHPSVQANKDLRVAYGLAFYDDLALPVLHTEALAWEQLVRTEATHLLPGVTVTLTGGFSRGKPQGHDIDLLLSHPVQGKEQGLLPRLLNRLESLGLVVYGKLEQSTFHEDVLRKGNKGNPSRNTLDHFEKWLGIVKIDKKHRGSKVSSKGKDTQEQPSTSIAHRQHKHNLDSLEEANYKPSLTKQCSLSKALAESQYPRDWLARRVDLILVPQDQFYYALIGWIGSRMFNRSIRRYADSERKMKLTSHGLYDHTTKRKLPARSQREVFDHLQLPYREPFERNC